jgi:hypothetical protein
MAAPRDTYKYQFKVGNQIVHCGMTSRTLEVREAEHRRVPGWEDGHIVQVGNRTTREAALDWEYENRCNG